ncbi:guanine permease [Halarsenatibacter silvermanii]|uniref:Putative MFS transporter, AGZA family, xanthine/uracil permease n=1 Tax=Halarsenatibacter silvermanii TaxID=321763 RepID=A0A1G9STC4_9FIRM|nr:guanine permease [Halarsenatibacter silvermanii]SDM38604.1 putative MFS transporter, AGZA family, xanthine/uracil permease [Halarsenatibacter silvermanii]
MIQDLLAALGVVVNGLPQGLLAMSFGFAAVPSAIAFIIGAVGVGALGLVAPISFQAETITLAGKLGDSYREKLSMVFMSGAIMGIIGVFGLLETVIDFVGTVITSGMMAGVGIMLSLVAVNMTRENRPVGLSSIATGLLVYVFTQDLVYTIVLSVAAGSVVGYLIEGERPGDFATEELLKIRRPVLNLPVLRGALALVCLTIGANIAFGEITASLAGRPINIDHLTVVSGLGNMGSSLFGGAPVESIISATGAAPRPVLSAVMMMSIMAVILLAGFLPRLGKYVPAQAISGFLLVLGAIVTVPDNLEAAAADPLVGGVTVTMTAITDPFIGLVSGLVVKMLSTAVGL